MASSHAGMPSPSEFDFSVHGDVSGVSICVEINVAFFGWKIASCISATLDVVQPRIAKLGAALLS